ncbi:MAG: class I SAM-dependent methyltransferase family protein [Candidatus Aenigmatarchaeota archaeon]
MNFGAKLRLKLKGRLFEKELALLPSGYQIIGKILLIKLRPGLYRKRKLIGKACLELLPYLDSAYLQKGISDAVRTPKVEWLAGKRCSETLHREHGCSFLLDVRKIMWSQGNKAEKIRLAAAAKPGETVVDMFAGIGYWSIPLAKHAKVKKIYAIDINPAAIKYLKMNVAGNGLRNVEVLKGDCRRFARRLEGAADRVIMGYLWGTEKFLPAALRMAKKGAVIHCHCLLKDASAKKAPKGTKLLAVRRVKGYAPGISHYVLDLRKA